MRELPPSAIRVTYGGDELPGWTWSIVDTSKEGQCWQSAGEEVIHVMYARNEERCQIEVDGNSMPILPGDTIAIGAESSVGLSPDMLVLQIRLDRGDRIDVSTPTHGIEQFDGYNRRTIYATGPQIALERWKLTGPQVIPVDRELAIVVLYGKVSCVQAGAIETLDVGESLVAIGPGDVRIVPDGLGYVAIACPAS
jgi:hypothetical protein